MFEKINDLECIVFNAEKSAETAVVLFHGYGADATDLAPLQKFLDPSCAWDWYFPRAPREVDVGMGFMGRAWFDVNMNVAPEDLHDRYPVHKPPPGFFEAQDQAHALFESLKIDYDRLVFGGFSQGAILSVEFATHEKDLKELIILSGSLFLREQWKKLFSREQKLSFFQSHGTQDPLLGFAQAKELYELLIATGHQGDFHSFEGGHEIPLNVLKKLKDFLLKPS